jgi:hypothetical protein
MYVDFLRFFFAGMGGEEQELENGSVCPDIAIDFKTALKLLQYGFEMQTVSTGPQ